MPSSTQRSHALRLIREVLGRLGWRYKIYVPAVALVSMVFLLPPRLLQFFTGETQGLGESSGSDFVRTLVIFGALIAICLWGAIFLTGLMREWLRLTISVGLRRDSLKALHRTRIEAMDETHRGDWMTRVTSDLRNCEDFLSDSIPNQIQALTLALGSAVLFFFHSGPIALIPCAAAVILAVFNARVQQRMAPVLQENRELEGEVFQSLMENYEGLRTVRSSGGESQNLARLDRTLDRIFAAGMRIMRRMAALMGLNEFASQLVVTIALTVVAMALHGGEMTVESVLVYPFFINVFLSNARDLAAAAFDWNRFFIEGGRLASVLYGDGQLDEIDAGDEQKVDGDQLVVRGLVVGYGEAEPVIDGLDLSVGVGEVVAVMGASGCGKSTLLECLAGLRQPRGGKFEIGGEGVGHMPLNFASYVEQRPYLFLGTVRENLLLGNEMAISDEEIMGALDTVGLAKTIRERGGLDTVLNDRGLNMSEGQRYRLSLCRALLAGRRFLFLDEPFAALDKESIASVVEVIRSAKKNHIGVIVVTHVEPDGLPVDQIIRLGSL